LTVGMACTCKTPLVAFVVLAFVLAPLLSFALGLGFGAILAAAEGWPVFGVNGGFWYYAVQWSVSALFCGCWLLAATHCAACALVLWRQRLSNAPVLLVDAGT
jgi:hypothetical protein